MRTLMMVLVLCAAVATPAFAQDAKPDKGKQAEEAGKHKGGKFRQRMRNNRMARNIWRELTPEEREAVKERMKQRRDERKAKMQEWREKRDAMTPEEKEAFKAKSKEARAEARKRIAELRGRLKDMTPEERKAELKRLRDEFKKMREEQRR
ncbi:MAG: hypothetical protein KF696_12950 [Planctomycetes bacterium]|nr:hypothetical protein [Planctomycetota bacterium]MCW8135997.1 hypothetical protein [Planctomycetota bacterium]